MFALLNKTFFRNTLSFVVILVVAFLLLLGVEYVRSNRVTDQEALNSDCVTDTGEPC